MFRRLLFRWTPAAFALLLLGACSRRGEGQFIPQEAAARRALESSLDAWRNGRAKPGELTLDAVSIEVMDSLWSSGQKLKAYEIAAVPAGDGPPRFTVKLSLATGERTVTYVVLGKNPIWVYTEAEYKKLSGS